MKLDNIKKKKIYIGPIEIAGYYGNLTSGMRGLGADVTFLTYSSHVFGYSGEDVSRLTSIIKWLGNRRRAQKAIKNLPIKILLSGLELMAQFFFFIAAFFKFDVFIFGFGQSLLWRNMDLPVLRMFRKKIIFNMGMGSEMRPPYVDGALQSNNGDTQPSVVALYKMTMKIVNKVRRIEKYSDLIIGAPYSSSPFSKKLLINWFALGVPSLHKSTDVQLRSDTSVIKVLHSPSHPVAKGTNRIRQVIDSLRSKGFKIEYIEIIGRPNTEVIDALRECDFVIDQLFSDTPMAGFVTEAACFGKPAVVGGYGLGELKKYVPYGMFPPSQICHPDDLESAVEQMIVDHDYRNSLGQRAHNFVQTQWAANKVAERYLRLISGDIPEEWLLNPSDVIYLHGVGQIESQTKKNIQNLVEKYGVSALRLSHRPDLEQAFLAFAGIKE